MDKLFNFNLLFSPSDNSKKLSKNQVNKKFDEFIKETFANYLYKSAIFNKYAKVYDQDSSFTEECSDVYILSEQLYLNAIKKIQVPFDVKFNKSNNLYIFNLDDIHNNDYIFKDSANGRTFRPKKQKYLCKIIALVFVKLYILIKGIYSTFNHNLTYQEFISSKHKSKSIQSSEQPSLLSTDQLSEDPSQQPYEQPSELLSEQPAELSNELSNQVPSTDNNDTNQLGGGFLDNIRNFFTRNNNNESDNENDDDDEIYEKELSSDKSLSEEGEKEEEAEEEEEEEEEENDDDNEISEKDYDYDNESIDVNKRKKNVKKVKYNNIFFAFINSIFASDINQNESKLDMEFPPTLEDFIKNLNKSGIIDIICDTDYIYNTFKKNILFSPNNMNKVYESSPKILQRIKKIENEMLKEYNTKLSEKDTELKNIFRQFEIYNKLCNKLLTNFSIKDESRIYERIIKIVKTMFTNYTNNRNKLFNDIILKIFEFKDEIIKNEEGKVKEVKNNIIKIKDNITYKEIIKLTTNAKIIIYDLHIDFFNNLKEIFSLLNEKGVIKFDEKQDLSNPIITEQSEQDNNSTKKPSDSPVISNVDTSLDLPENDYLNNFSDTPDDTSVDKPLDTSVDTPDDTSVDTLDDTSVDTLLDTPLDTSVDTPLDTSVDTPLDTSVDIPLDTSVYTPDATSVDTPDATSVDTPLDIDINSNEINLKDQTVSSPTAPVLETINSKGGKKRKKTKKKTKKNKKRKNKTKKI